MHIPNQLNLLYVHPYKMSFSPVTDVANSDHRNHGFPDHSVWTASSHPRQLMRQDDGVPKLGQAETGRTRDSLDSD